MTNLVRIQILLLLLISLSLELSGQVQRFNAGIVVGLNSAELEGNSISDYLGWNAGIIGTAKLSDQWQLGMELLFSQNGEYILPEYYPQISYGKIKLNHFEIPVHIDFLTGTWKREGFYNWNLNLGLAYTRLLDSYAEDIDGLDVSDQIIYTNQEAFLVQGGLTHHFTKKLGLNLKATLPLRNKNLDWSLAARVIFMLT